MQNEIEENTTVAPWTDERFLRSRIVLGSEGLERLWGAHVVVVGYGAVGSAAAEALVRSGLGHIRIIDADVYDVTNTNRQLGCECSTIGKPKVEVGLAHFKALSPQID
ncbi:MAG: ThiF family adenylyltransferase, partial [Bradymonadales bacterium]|nr:ThiF family adenylyltransferase [Bradymonadales bacterium]